MMFGPRPNDRSTARSFCYPGSFGVPASGSDSLRVDGRVAGAGTDGRGSGSPHNSTRHGKSQLFRPTGAPTTTSKPNSLPRKATARAESKRPSTAPAKLFKSCAQDALQHKRSPAELFMCIRMWMRQHRQQQEKLQDTLISLLLSSQDNTVQPSLHKRSEQPQGDKYDVATEEPRDHWLTERRHRVRSSTGLSLSPTRRGNKLEAHLMGDVTIDTIRNAWERALYTHDTSGAVARMGASLTIEEAAGLLHSCSPAALRHCLEPADTLSVPLDLFLKAALHTEGRENASLETCRGVPAMPAQAQRHRIIAHPSWAAMVPPSEFDWDAAARNAADMPAALELEHVHGYESVRNSAPNLFFSSSGHIVHYAAALGIVTDLSSIPVSQRISLDSPSKHSAVRTVSVHSCHASMQPASSLCEAADCQRTACVENIYTQQRVSHAQDVAPAVAESQGSSEHEGLAVALSSALIDECSADADACAFSAASVTVEEQLGSECSGVSIVVGAILEDLLDNAADTQLTAYTASDCEDGSEHSGVSAAVLSAIDQCVAAASQLGASDTQNSVSERSGTSAEVDAIVHELVGSACGSSDTDEDATHELEVEQGDTVVVQVPDEATDMPSLQGSVAGKLNVDGAVSELCHGDPSVAYGERQTCFASGQAVQSLGPFYHAADKMEDIHGACVGPVAVPGEQQAGEEYDKIPEHGQVTSMGENTVLRLTNCEEQQKKRGSRCKSFPARQWQQATCLQTFFRGHDDDVLCLCMHPNRNIIASGQVSTTSGSATAVVWQVGTCEEIARIVHPTGSRGVYACGFSGDGKLLVTVTGDNQNTVRVYEWASQRLVANGIGHNGVPPQVFGVTFDPFEGSCLRFVTWGLKHIKMWEYSGHKEQVYRSRSCSWGSVAAQDVLCAHFLPSCLDQGISTLSTPCTVPRKGVREHGMDCCGLLATGHTSGCIYFWRNRVVISTLQASDTDPKQRVESKGCPSFVIESSAGIRCIRVWRWSMPENQEQRSVLHKHLDEQVEKPKQRWCLAASSQEGAVHIWGITACHSGHTHVHTDKNTAEARRIVSLWLPRHMGGPTRSAVRSFDVSNGSCGVFTAVIGAYDGTVWLCSLDLESKWQDTVCDNPLMDFWHTCSTSGLQREVLFWHATTRTCLGAPYWPVAPATSIAFSLCGSLFAMGLATGAVEICDRNRVQLYLFSMFKDKLHPIARCRGHAAAVMSIDWSQDSCTIRTVCSACEILFWEVPSGRRVTSAQKDQCWQTWTSKVGFGVMGIWRSGDDRSDINSVSVDDFKQLVAVGDDDGTVRLARYPCVMREAAMHRYRAHAAHVTAVRWVSQGKRVISSGGRDACVVQWRVARDSDVCKQVVPVPAASPHCSTFETQDSSRNFCLTGNSSLLADILGTLRFQAAGSTKTGKHASLTSLDSFSAERRQLDVGNDDRHLLGPVHLGQSLKTQPCAAVGIKSARSQKSQDCENETPHTWGLTAATAEAKSKRLTHSMSMLQQAQTSLDSQLKDMKQMSRQLKVPTVQNFTKLTRAPAAPEGKIWGMLNPTKTGAKEFGWVDAPPT